jgi:hypothetical protein
MPRRRIEEAWNFRHAILKEGCCSELMPPKNQHIAFSRAIIISLSLVAVAGTVGYQPHCQRDMLLQLAPLTKTPSASFSASVQQRGQNLPAILSLARKILAEGRSRASKQASKHLLSEKAARRHYGHSEQLRRGVCRRAPPPPPLRASAQAPPVRAGTSHTAL